MAYQPQRRDIIEMYMSIGHDHIVKTLSKYWEKEALNLSAFDTLSLIDWVNTYLTDLKRFGITDMYL